MKKLFLFLCLCCGSLCVQAQNLDSLLKAVYKADQAVRREQIRISSQKPLVLDSLLAVIARCKEVDAQNQRVVFALLDGPGWPKGLSELANHAIWIVLDHADAPDLKRYMPLVEQQAEAGVITKSDYATMLDRMLMHEGLRQRYGTQTVMNRVNDEPAVIYVWPIEDAARLDKLRKQMGLPSMNRYVKRVRQVHGGEVVWDPALGIEDMPVKYPRM